MNAAEQVVLAYFLNAWWQLSLIALTCGRAGRIPRSNQPYIGETLSFDLPPAGPIRRCDAVRVIFHLTGMRADRRAKIGIESFVLVPRGA